MLQLVLKTSYASSQAVTNTGPSIIGGDLGCYPTPMTPPQPAGASVTGINYGASSVAASAQADAATAYASLLALAQTSTSIAPVMDSTRRFPGVYRCIPYCNIGGGVLTLDAQGVSDSYCKTPIVCNMNSMCNISISS